MEDTFLHFNGEDLIEVGEGIKVIDDHFIAEFSKGEDGDGLSHGDEGDGRKERRGKKGRRYAVTAYPPRS